MKPRTDQPAAAWPAGALSVDVALLEELFDLVPDVAFFVKDADGRYVSINQSLATRHGLNSKVQAIGRKPSDICPGEFGRVPTEQDRAVLTTGRPLIDHLECQWHVPHEPVWCLTTKLPIRDPTGRIIGLVGFSRDVRVTIEPSEVPREFAAAMAVFERDLPTEASPAWLAQRSNLSPQRLVRLTKRIFDLTPSQLITKTRTAAASLMLIDTKDSISDIAHACGFCDHSAFSRAFRSATGFTPSEFRSHWARKHSE